MIQTYTLTRYRRTGTFAICTMATIKAMISPVENEVMVRGIDTLIPAMNSFPNDSISSLMIRSFMNVQRGHP